ncbi:hypothetical protein PVAP13_8KG102000 [Panicum virgatum]|uniref:Uncharacterized protein n=1 Tax=Panicum virgatum TaxID=38727 RepID=A0A8T0PMZ2_PANVG|nr:hypothetical protein PVAP13_8KG102000 [Panicum virgatum]
MVGMISMNTHLAMDLKASVMDDSLSSSSESSTKGRGRKGRMKIEGDSGSPEVVTGQGSSGDVMSPSTLGHSTDPTPLDTTASRPNVPANSSRRVEGVEGTKEACREEGKDMCRRLEFAEGEGANYSCSE